MQYMVAQWLCHYSGEIYRRSVPVPPESFYCELCRLNRADPFWVTVAHPLYPAKLSTSNFPTDGTNPVQSIEKSFQLTRPDKDLLAKPEYDVQAWCILLNDKVSFRLQWPQYADLQVNGVPMRVINRPGSQLLGANGRDDGAVITPCTKDGVNKISLTGCDARVFCMGVRILIATLQVIHSLIPKECDGERFEDSLARVRHCVGGGDATKNADSDSDLEVVADSIVVKLYCPDYESLGEDEADLLENAPPTATGHRNSEASSKKVEKKKAPDFKRKRSKVWTTFTLFTDAEKLLRAKCSKCGYTCLHDSKNGTGNLLKHQKACVDTKDIRQMVLSSSDGSMTMRNILFDPQVFRDLITNAVIRHNLPLHFVEYEGIREAFKYAHPQATLVSRNTLKADILACYQFEKKKLFNSLQHFEGRVCLTSDLWTSVATDGYMTLTAHFITADWVLHKKLLNFSYLPSPHTGITISDKVYKLLCDWNLESKLFSITLDNAASNDLFVAILRTQLNLRNALLNKGEFFHIRCCAHILNLIVQEGLKELDEAVVKIRESVKYIKGSQGRKEKFRECISQVALEKKRGLRQDVPTRWNSTYLMLDSALYYRRAFVHLQLTDSNYKYGLLDEEWDKVEGICKFLGVFYNVTRLFSGSKYPTANLYFPNVFLVEHTLMKAAEDRNNVATSLAERMRPKFSKYWKDYSMILAIAVVFDPRYKTQFVEFSYKMLYGDDSVQIAKLHITLKALFDLYKDKIPSYASTDDVLGTKVQNEGADVLKEFDALDDEVGSALEKTELDRYLEEKRLNRNLEIDILEYWRTNQFRFPNLSLMARDVLSIPISTVASESAFSVGGRILDQYRSSLASTVVESIICARDWKFNEQAAVDCTWEELTEDIMNIALNDDSDFGNETSVPPLQGRA